MHQVFQLLAQVAQWCVANPRNTQIAYNLLRGAQRGYEQLSPATKAKVDSIMIRAAEYLVKAAVGDVLGWARSEAVSLGLNSDAATVAEVGVRRVAEVGLAKAFEEMRKPGGTDTDAVELQRLEYEQGERERIANEHAERERQAALALEARRAIEYEQDRPWRIMRNIGRLAGVVALGIATIACFTNASGLSGFCFVRPLGLVLGIATLYALGACGQAWEEMGRPAGSQIRQRSSASANLSVGQKILAKEKWGLADSSRPAEPHMPLDPATNLAGSLTCSINPNTSEICYYGHTTRRVELKQCYYPGWETSYVCPRCCHVTCKATYRALYDTCQAAGWPVWPPAALESDAEANMQPVGPLLSDPGNLRDCETKIGAEFLFRLTGRANGTVYGTDTYTSDSNLATAAVHAGILQPGEQGVVRVRIVSVLSSYRGSTRNGVSTHSWSSPWTGAYCVMRA
jgi:hypothetical protein